MRETNRPAIRVRQLRKAPVSGSLGKFSADLALCLVRGSCCVYYRCWARLLVVRGAAVEPCHQVAVGGAGGGEFVVAVLEVLALVEEFLFEFGNPLTESADFVGSGEASVVEDLFAEDFGQSLAELLEVQERHAAARTLPVRHRAGDQHPGSVGSSLPAGLGSRALS